MRRGVIRIGDPLSSGGQVVSACSNFKVDGKEVAGVGDACHCNRHGDVQIVEGIETFTFFGKKLALHDCKVSCGCSVISTTELMVVDTGGGSTAQGSQAEPLQAEPLKVASVETKSAMTLEEKNMTTKPWNDTMVIILDEKYNKKIPEFVQRQIDALNLTATSVNHKVSILFHFINGLNERLSSANGTNESETIALAFKNEMVLIGKSRSAQFVASILPPIPWSRMNGGDLGGEGFTQKHLASGISILLSSNNSRGLAHEFLHAIGYSKGKWDNTPPFNYFHNEKFNSMMDSAGVPQATFPKDY